MKIIVLNGSPKGDIGITMQYLAYIRKRLPQHELKIINISCISYLCPLSITGLLSLSGRGGAIHLFVLSLTVL